LPTNGLLDRHLEPRNQASYTEGGMAYRAYWAIAEAKTPANAKDVVPRS
jgi:hypothetical protein